MGMDAQMIARRDGLHLGDNVADFARHGATIGVAEHDPAGTGIERRLHAGQRVIGICLEAIKEVLAIDQRFLASRHRSRNRFAQIGEVVFKGDFERDCDLMVPCLGDKAGRFRG